MKAILPLVFVLLCCKKSNTQPEPPIKGFEETPVSSTVTGASITEASGIADSKRNPGLLWVQEDSGNPARLFLLKHDGSVSDSVLLQGAVNRDWEDMSVANGPVDGENYLYIADIGDNREVQSEYSFYRFAEPLAGAGSVDQFDKISFGYPDSAHDAEAFLVDDVTKDLYIITKRDARSGVYKLAYPQSTTDLNEAVFVGQLDYTGVVSAAMSPDGKEMILKTYTTVYYYERRNREALSETLTQTPLKLGYQLEVQGEAIGFAAQNNGFFTFSEEAMGIVPALNFYKRK